MLFFIFLYFLFAVPVLWRIAVLLFTASLFQGWVECSASFCEIPLGNWAIWKDWPAWNILVRGQGFSPGGFHGILRCFFQWGSRQWKSNHSGGFTRFKCFDYLLVQDCCCASLGTVGLNILFIEEKYWTWLKMWQEPSSWVQLLLLLLALLLCVICVFYFVVVVVVIVVVVCMFVFLLNKVCIFISVVSCSRLVAEEFVTQAIDHEFKSHPNVSTKSAPLPIKFGR